MTDEQLLKIEERANQFTEFHSLEYWTKVVGEDFPALIAEIRRLKTWQPIDTAPEDGEFLAWDGAIFLPNDYDFGGVPRLLEATHWLPLPGEPEEWTQPEEWNHPREYKG